MSFSPHFFLNTAKSIELGQGAYKIMRLQNKLDDDGLLKTFFGHGCLPCHVKLEIQGSICHDECRLVIWS
jgi:hypothetical protein